MSTQIRLVSSSDGEYQRVLINGVVDYEGNSIPDFYWIDLLASYGFNAKILPDISPDQMQERNYYGEE